MGYLMTQKEKELLISWLVNEEMRIESELIEVRNKIRFRNIDLTDNIEMILLQQRLSDFREFSKMLIRLLNLDI